MTKDVATVIYLRGRKQDIQRGEQPKTTQGKAALAATLAELDAQIATVQQRAILDVIHMAPIEERI